MLFVVKADVYNDDSCNIDGYGMFVSATDTVNAVQKVADWYGETNINYLSIKPFAPVDMLVFEFKDTEETDEFYLIEEKLGERVIW